MGKILIKNGRVWDGQRFLEADVLTDGAVVARIAKVIEDEADFVFDAKGMTVSAGLVDAHMHIQGLSGPVYAISAEAACFPFGATAAIEAGGRLGNRETVEQLAVKALVFVDTKTEENHLNTQLTRELIRGAEEVFRKKHVWRRDIRSVSVRAIYITPENAPEQLDLVADPTREAEHLALEKTVDGLRERYGTHAINSGSYYCAGKLSAMEFGFH